MSALWHYQSGGSAQGPIDEGRLRKMLERGQISPQTEVWREGMLSWEPAEACMELRDAIPAGAPQSLSTTDDSRESFDTEQILSSASGPSSQKDEIILDIEQSPEFANTPEGLTLLGIALAAFILFFIYGLWAFPTGALACFVAAAVFFVIRGFELGFGRGMAAIALLFTFRLGFQFPFSDWAPYAIVFSMVGILVFLFSNFLDVWRVFCLFIASLMIIILPTTWFVANEVNALRKDRETYTSPELRKHTPPPFLDEMVFFALGKSPEEYAEHFQEAMQKREAERGNR